MMKIKPRIVIKHSVAKRALCIACADYTTEPKRYEGDDVDYCSDCFFTNEQWAALNVKIGEQIVAEAAAEKVEKAAKAEAINAKIAAKKAAAINAKLAAKRAAKLAVK